MNYRRLRTLLPALSKATNSDTNLPTSDALFGPVQQNASKDRLDATNGTEQAVESSCHEVDGSVTDLANYPDDGELAKKTCRAIANAAARIKTTGVPDWWSDLETLKPRGQSLYDADEALQSHAKVDMLDQACEKYCTSLVYRASMTWLIRCFLEIIRRAFHRPSRATATNHKRDRVDREQRCRVGELMIATTKPLYEKYGRKAYTLYALLAGQ